MSVIQPQINDLLDKTENNPFLLCSIASKRACDINDMLRDQHLRVTAVQAIDDITTIASGKDSIGIAMSEISEGSLSFVKDAFDDDIKGANSKYDQID